MNNSEMILIFAAILILLGSKRLPPAIARMLAASREVIDEMSAGAGRSLGGIYGKRAAEALTPENQTAELYRPSVFQKDPSRKWKIKRLISHFLHSVKVVKILFASKVLSPLSRAFRSAKLR